MRLKPNKYLAVIFLIIACFNLIFTSDYVLHNNAILNLDGRIIMNNNLSFADANLSELQKLKDQLKSKYVENLQIKIGDIKKFLNEQTELNVVNCKIAELKNDIESQRKAFYSDKEYVDLKNKLANLNDRLLVGDPTDDKSLLEKEMKGVLSKIETYNVKCDNVLKPAIEKLKNLKEKFESLSAVIKNSEYGSDSLLKFLNTSNLQYLEEYKNLIKRFGVEEDNVKPYYNDFNYI